MRYVGPKKRAVAEYVAAHPGCTKVAAGRYAWLLNHGAGVVPGKDNVYNPVNRAVAAGLVRAELTTRGYKLFAV
jgi:hypothetical protein